MVRFGMKKYRVIARRPFRADVAISRYNDAVSNAGTSKACTKIYFCLQHFRQPTSYREWCSAQRIHNIHDCRGQSYLSFLPRRFAPRNDMVVFTWLRRFEQPDKLKFEHAKKADGNSVGFCHLKFTALRWLRSRTARPWAASLLPRSCVRAWKGNTWRKQR